MLRRQTAASDVDVLVVYAGDEAEEAYSLAWDILDIPQLQLHVYPERLHERLRAMPFSIPSVAERKGITVNERRDAKND